MKVAAYDPEDDSDNGDNIFKAQDDDKVKLKTTPPWMIKLEKWLDSWLVSGVMTLITIYALFFDDIRVLYVPPAWDDVFFGVTSVSLVCFTIEIVVASVAK